MLSRFLQIAIAIATVASTGMLAAGPASANVDGTIIRDTAIYLRPSIQSDQKGSALKGQTYTFVCWVNPTHTYPFFKLDQNGYYIPRDFVDLSSRNLSECAS
jgi:hypothetical protein